VSILYSLRKVLGSEPNAITLIGERQDDGYIFITSSELKGFSLMLEPDEDKNLATLMNAVYEPLTGYLDALYGAGHKAITPKGRYEVKGFSKTSPYSYTARLSTC
jgi:hypothetical protein